MEADRRKVKENLEQEYQRFKADMLSLTKEEVYGNSYRIEIMQSLYRILLNVVEGMAEDKVVMLGKKTNLLSHLFQRWLKVDDGSDMELKACVEMELHLMRYRKEE